MTKNNNNKSRGSSSSNSNSRSARKLNGSYPEQVIEPEVIVLARRRQFSAKYKAQILAEADGCTKAGEIGALLRREGLYSSNLSNWRKERSQGKGLKPQKRGRKGSSPSTKEMAHLQAENRRLRAELERAETIIDVQKKVSSLFGIATPGTTEPEEK